MLLAPLTNPDQAVSQAYMLANTMSNELPAQFETYLRSVLYYLGELVLLLLLLDASAFICSVRFGLVWFA